MNAMAPTNAVHDPDGNSVIDWAWAFPDILEKLCYRPYPCLVPGLRQNFDGLDVNFRDATWFCRNTLKSGGPRELIQHKLGITAAEAERWLETEGLARSIGDRDSSMPEGFSSAYDYHNERGELAFKVVNLPDGEENLYEPDFRGGFSPLTTTTAGVSLIPYRLPELLAAKADTPIIVVRNEVTCELVAAAGLTVTTFPGYCEQLQGGRGHHAFRGRSVAIVSAGSEADREWAASLKADLEQSASKVLQIDLPRLRADCDTIDWLRDIGSAEELGALCRHAFGLFSAEGLPLLHVGDIAYLNPSPRRWVWHEHVPLGQMSLLTGAGGVGKSLLGQELATAVALGRECLGLETMGCSALYVTCEDDPDELIRRQHSMCRLYNVSAQELEKRLYMSSWQGLPGNELMHFLEGGQSEESPRYKALVALCRRLQIRFIVLDNVAHLFGGDENRRQDVARFTNLLNRLAIEIDGAVLLIGHPNKAGDEVSGSTAWENQVRSRLFMDCPTDKNGEPLAPNLRTLGRSKSNYAQRGHSLNFHWHRGAFVRSEDLPVEEGASLDAQMRSDAEDKRFLECLNKVTAERRAVSPHSSAANYAPRVFQKMPAAKGMKAKSFEAAMHRLLDRGVIAGDQRLWQRENRAWVRGLGLLGTSHEARTYQATDVHEAAEASL